MVELSIENKINQWEEDSKTMFDADNFNVDERKVEVGFLLMNWLKINGMGEIWKY